MPPVPEKGVTGPTVLERVITRLNDSNSRITSALAGLENGLIKISHLSSETSQSPSAPEKEPVSFEETVSGQLNRLEALTGRLEDLKKHLDSII